MDMASRWFQLAREDLLVAEVTFREGVYNQTCFHSQQTAEKALKGFLAGRGRAVPRTHSLAELIELCCSVERGLEALKGECLNLDKYYIPTRYPDALPGSLPEGLPDAKDAEEALEAAKRILTSVGEQIREA